MQGTSIINQFSAEGNLLALAGGFINTRSQIPEFGDGAQYALDGTPTGVIDPPSLPAGETLERTYDGTSDGTYNYYAQLFGSSGGPTVHDVYRTNLDWSNPQLLFSAPYPSYGIAYDPDNTSLWISYFDFVSFVIADYSLDGTLLSSFATSTGNYALAYDAADGTLWSQYGGLLRQYSTDGTLLQSGAISGLSPASFGGEILNASDPPASTPEPATWPLISACLLAATFARRMGAFARPLRHGSRTVK